MLEPKLLFFATQIILQEHGFRRLILGYCCEILRHLALIVIDKSFIDFSDLESSGRSAVNAKNVIVVKSMGKALGWHGIRLGYAVANERMAQKLRMKFPYWNINGLASFVLKMS